jgi:signal transduction histidine kinase
VIIITDFGDLIAERMRIEHRALAARWFDRLLDLLPVDAREVFPTESLLDHVPSLILEISAYLADPEEGAIAANTAILDKARELGALRFSQRASLHQLLREYQLLSAILVTFVQEEIARLDTPPPAAATVRVVSRLHDATNVLSQSTVESFVTLYTQTIAEQAQRLEQFTRMAAHEWRQPLGALQVGVNLLSVAKLDPVRTQRTLDALGRSVTHLVELTHKLESVARMHDTGDSAVVQEVCVATVVEEAARQLREMAEARGVEIRVVDSLPTLKVNVGRLELAFVNLLSNAIKYSDADKPSRYVEVSGEGDNGFHRILIRDNGIGIPAEALKTIFKRFTRAHADRGDLSHVPGIGLGLAIVDDCVQSIGGIIEVESDEGTGTTFVLRLPLTPPPAAGNPLQEGVRSSLNFSIR